MSYSSTGILCRKCLDTELPEGELIRYLDQYVLSLPEDIRSSDETYRRRLSACSECEHRMQATCSLCGCYCQARAAKRKLRCPIPKSPRWTEEESNSNPECDTK
ncbi:MAG: hypothetical protein IKJ65_00985 [Clostridia bacterium]|nr:hypothetical protein [Clostridia bacterium]